jgi:hypothetical protein
LLIRRIPFFKGWVGSLGSVFVLNLLWRGFDGAGDMADEPGTMKNSEHLGFPCNMVATS